METRSAWWWTSWLIYWASRAMLIVASCSEWDNFFYYDSNMVINHSGLVCLVNPLPLLGTSSNLGALLSTILRQISPSSSSFTANMVKTSNAWLYFLCSPLCSGRLPSISGVEDAGTSVMVFAPPLLRNNPLYYSPEVFVRLHTKLLKAFVLTDAWVHDSRFSLKFGFPRNRQARKHTACNYAISSLHQ